MMLERTVSLSTKLRLQSPWINPTALPLSSDFREDQTEHPPLAGSLSEMNGKRDLPIVNRYFVYILSKLMAHALRAPS